MTVLWILLAIGLVLAVGGPLGMVATAMLALHAEAKNPDVAPSSTYPAVGMMLLLAAVAGVLIAIVAGVWLFGDWAARLVT